MHIVRIDVPQTTRCRLATAIPSSTHRSSLWGAGIFGVELFAMANGSVLLNEIAPRPHNSGHYTMDACVTEQHEMHLRAVAGLPLGDPSLKASVRPAPRECARRPVIVPRKC